MSAGIELSAQSDILLRRVEAEIRRRPSTDRRMGVAWTIVPILPIFVGVALSVALVGMVISTIPNLQQATSTIPAVADILALYVFALIAIIAVLILDAFAFYFLLDRRNRHFKRQQLLFAAISEYLMAIRKNARFENIARLAEVSSDSIFEEQVRPASLWAILCIFAIPIVGLIVAYGLTEDLRKHEERQLAYQQTLIPAFEEAGITQAPNASFKPHSRDPIVYLVLTAITAGLFWVYWFYTLLKDYNEHFADQAALEDQILLTLKPMFKCAACGGSIPPNVKFCPLCGAAQPDDKEVAAET